MSTRLVFVALLSAVLLSSCSSSSNIRPNQCDSCTVSAKVSPLLAEAQIMAQAGDLKAATAKLNEAEAVKVYPDDETVINQLRHYIAVTMSADPPLTRRMAPLP